MKKIYEIIKPFLLIILGALMLLCYLNLLQGQEGILALGIIALVAAVFYLAYGIVGIILGDKLPAGLKRGLDIAAICVFPVFMFVYYLISVITILQNDGVVGPSGWIISILGMVAAIGLVAAYIVATFVKMKLLARLAQLFALAFVLSLLLNMLFDAAGNPNVLGNINVVELLIYVSYGALLFAAVPALNGKPEEKAE